MERSSGILLSISSLPSRYGIGTFGKAAYLFADFLKAAGQKYWQVLPLGPTSYGDSPYQSFSTFAGNPYFIDLDLLISDGLLNRAEVAECAWGSNPRYIDYGKIYESRYKVLTQAKLRGWTRDREKIRVDFNVFASEVQDEYHVTEREAKFFMESTDAVAECIEQGVAHNIIRSVFAVFNGVYAMSMDVPGLVETSSNLARIRTEEGKVTMLASQRSSVESGKYAVQATLAACFRLAGAKVTSNDGYPGWAPNPKSELLDISVRTYKELFGRDPKVKAIHAGLECGLFLTSYPDLDMISIGPTLRGVHSPSERLELATVPMVFDHLLAILRAIGA